MGSGENFHPPHPMQGYCQIHRDIIGKSVFKASPSVFKLYMYLRLMCNHSDNGKFKRNEHITTYRKIKADTGLNFNSISGGLDWLKKEGYISVIPAKATHILLRNP